MADAKHTPGPWSCGGGKYLPILAETPKGHAQIGRAESFGHISDEECEANGALIAASPTLLDALAGMVELYAGLVNSGDCGNWDPEMVPAVIAARAAIAKAKGEVKP